MNSLNFLGFLLLAIVIQHSAINGHNNAELERQPSDTKQGLRLPVEIDRKIVRMNDAVKAKIRLANVSPSPITIYKEFGWGPSSSFTSTITDMAKKVILSTTFPDAQDRPPFIVEQFITIQPGKSLELERWLDIRSEGIKVPGEYKYTIWYHSPVSLEFAPSGMEIWPMENGDLESKPITFKVIK